MFAIQRPQPLNPYIAGRALRDERGFFGRAEILDLVSREMASPSGNALVLYGQRRMGKTSILLQLQRRLPAHQFLPIYFDLMDRAASPLGHVLFELACAMSGAASLAVPDIQRFDGEGLFFRTEFVPKFCARTGGGIRPVLLFDEFDTATGLGPSAASSAFYPFLRRIVETEPRLGFVFTSCRKGDIGIKTARYARIPVLDPPSARELIRSEGRPGALAFSPAASERVFELTAGHPYLTQLVCQLIWEGTAASATVETPDVDAAADQALEAGENGFEWIWESLLPAEKVIYAAIASVTETQPHASLEAALKCLRTSGIGVLTREMETAPETLVESGFLEEREGQFNASVELMRRWTALSKPLIKVKDELDRVVPLADTLYQSGDGFYRRGNLDSSQSLLQQALALNSNHLKARLLLAQVFAEQGRLDESIAELERAYRCDPAVARLALVRTLMVRAEELERKLEWGAALGTCQRVLDIWPGHPEATQVWTAIWKQRGDKSFAADQLDEASEAYAKIGVPELIGKVAARKRALRIDRLTKGAHALAADQQWAEAAKAYRELAQLEPRESAWSEAATLCETEHHLDALYVEACQAIESGGWGEARDRLIRILAQRSEYRDSSLLLIRALTPPSVAKDPVIGPFLVLYFKFLVVLAVCIVAGLLRVHSGNGDLGTAMGFYLGTAVVLAVVLAVIEFGSQMFVERKRDTRLSLLRPRE